MKFIMKSFLAGIAMLAMSGVASADVVYNAAAPTANVVLDATVTATSTTTVSTLINSDAAQGARGTNYSLAGLGAGQTVTISGFTVQMNTTALTTATSLTLAAYKGSDYTGIVGGGSFANVTPTTLYAGAGITESYTETFALDLVGGGAANSNFVTLNLATPFNVSSDDTLGFMIFTAGGQFSQLEGNTGGGGRLQFRETTTLIAPSSRSMNFLVLGTVAVPEPGSLAALGFAGIGMIARRRRS